MEQIFSCSGTLPTKIMKNISPYPSRPPKAFFLTSRLSISPKIPLTNRKITLILSQHLQGSLQKQIYMELLTNLSKSLRKSLHEKARKKTPTSLTFFWSHFLSTTKFSWNTRIRSMKKRLPKWAGDLRKKVSKGVFYTFFKCCMEVNQQHNIKT